MGSHIINDPVHGVMAFDRDEKKLLKRFIDKELFQRLRRIKQLGCGDLIFPGAVHTRFNHSIGVCYLAKRVCQHLRIGLKNETERHEIMVAALLHDVGHGPFSHAFESLFDIKYKEKIKNELLVEECKIKHDKEWLKMFIENFPNSFNKKINKKKITSILIDKTEGIASEIISSQLDVDRMDYLLRDSHFCGVPYGKIDLKWLISSLSKIPINKNPRLGITKKGIGALEHYILARRLMTRNIYYHGKIKAAEYYVREFLHELIKNYKKYNLKNFVLLKFLIKYNEYSEKVVTLKSIKDIKNSKKSFLKSAFNLYKNITDDDIWYLIKTIANKNESNKCVEISKRLIKRILPEYFSLDPSTISKARDIIEKYKLGQKSQDRWKIHLDDLNDVISYKKNKGPIYLSENQSGRDISYLSKILDFLSDRGEATYYLYLDSDMRKKGVAKKLLSDLRSNGCLLHTEIHKNNSK